MGDRQGETGFCGQTIAGATRDDRAGPQTACGPPDAGSENPVGRRRSEEHTSELQSLMRISYAVFCLKKKKKKTKHTTESKSLHHQRDTKTRGHIKQQ